MSENTTTTAASNPKSDQTSAASSSTKSNTKGTAGRTNYSEWEKKTSQLLSSLESEEKLEQEESSKELGLQDGKYARSEAEKKEIDKAGYVKNMKNLLDGYKKREENVHQVLSNLIQNNGDEQKEDSPGGMTKFITQNDMEAGKRVLTISKTNGPGHLILSEDLSNLKSIMPTNTTLVPKAYPQDAENSIPNDVAAPSKSIYGLIKLHLNDLHDLTVSVRCKVITGVLEVSHCSNLIIKIEGSSSIVTTQLDLSHNVTIQFHDAPSGKSRPTTATSNSTNIAPGTSFWGDDKDDRIFHAGVSNLKVELYRDGYLEMETCADYEKDGATSIGNATKEEMQFITSVVDGALLTEKVARSSSSTTAGSIGGGASSEAGGGGGARAMTEREMKEVEKKKELIRKAVDERLGSGIKVLDKDGKEVIPKNDKASNDDDGGIIEEMHMGMSPSDIEAIVKDCEAQKAEGNTAFSAGEYAQAVLLYTLALDKAAELPNDNSIGDDKSKNVKKPLFPKHIVLSNRSACFLKLGHHDKALEDGIEAERLDGTYVKGIFRKGMALHAMGRYQEAVASLSAALKLEPKNKQIKQALQFADIRFQQEMRKRMSR